jgi:hypothetical protein
MLADLSTSRHRARGLLAIAALDRTRIDQKEHQAQQGPRLRSAARSIRTGRSTAGVVRQ